jgi:ABC-type transport system involved in multi-copper enzyme maturation permease subunit
VIAWAGIRSLLARRLVLALLAFAWMPFLVRAVQIYLSVNFGEIALLAPTAETFRDFLEQQNFFVFVVTIYIGAPLIADDRRANALALYLSKPLGRAEYVAGKLAILFAFLLFVTWLPAMSLLGVQMAFSGSAEFVARNLFLIPAITLLSGLKVLLASLTILALSSLSTSSRYVGMLYAGVIIFSDAMFQALRGATGGSTAAWVSVIANLSQVGDVIFRLPARYDTPWLLSALVTLGLLGLSIVVLERRVRAVEVIT